MNLRTVRLIARKEFVDVLRDRRTLFFMLLLPMGLIPLLMIGTTEFMKKQIKAKESRVLEAAVNPGGGELLRALGNRWIKEHSIQLGVLAAKLELDWSGDLTSMFQQLGELLEKLSALREGAGQEIGDAAMVAKLKAYTELSAEQQQLAQDAGAIHQFTEKTRFIGLGTLTARGTLGPGVVIPGELPPALADPRVAVAIQDKQVHAAFSVGPEVLELLEDPEGTATVHILYDRSISLSKELYDRFAAFVDALTRFERDMRLSEAGLRPSFIEPFDIGDADIATPSRKIQALVGGFLPYLIIILCFWGAFYPALDLTAGEKERFTLETLLLAPVSRLDIAAGKFVVVFVAAVISALLTIASMYFTFTEGILPQGTTEQFDLEFQPLAMLLTGSLLLPMAALVAALVLGIALCGRSFKEAQNYVAPLQFLFFIPALAALMPDLETETHLAWIPLVNVSLLMKELMKGNYLWEFYWITLGSLLVLTALVLWGSSLLFRRESVLMRT